MDDMNVTIQKYGCKRQRLDSCCEISGQLTARSHIIHSQPTSILIEICTRDSVEYIIDEQQQTFKHVDSLCIGKSYNFLDLAAAKIQLKKSIVKCFRFTKTTTWKEIENLVDVHQPESLRCFKNITGNITKIDDELGVYYIDDIMIIVSSCSRIALHHMPKVGQEVTIFNTHRITSENGQKIYALCAKSFISITADKEKSVPTLNLSPLLHSLGDMVRDYRLILWLHECSSSLQKSLSDDFLKCEGISVQLCNKFRLAVLESLAKCALSSISPSKVSPLEEFVTPNHRSCCGTLNELMNPVPLLNLLQVSDENPNLEKELKPDGQPVYWQYDVKKNQKKFLVGLLSMRNSSHRLCLSDGSDALNCFVLPGENQTAIADGMAEFGKSFILAWDYDVIREMFYFEADKSANRVSSQMYKSVAIYMDKTKKFHITSTNEIDVYSYDQEKNKFCIEPRRNPRSKHPITVNTYNQVSEAPSGGSKCVSLTKPISPPLKIYLSQYIMIQSKSSIMAPETKKPARSFILVSLLGKMVSTKHMIPRGNNASTTIFICLEKSMLQIHPLLCVNTVYEMRIPVQYDCFLKKGAPVKQFEGLSNMLPTINCVTLPVGSEIHTVPDLSIPTGSLVHRDVYNIDQALREANLKELINIVGYIIGRYHLDPQYDREKVCSKVNGFGVPGCKVIAVSLCDTPIGGQISTPATLYLSYLPTLQYPIGLVSGAKVMFRFVMKHLPSLSPHTKSAYFRSSILTSMEILELTKIAISDLDQSKKDLWGPRSLLHCALSKELVGCQWMSVSMTQLLKISLSAECSSCHHPVLNSKCTFVGCSSSAFSTFCQASFMLHEFGCQPILVLLRHALVPKLFQGSDKLWDMVAKLTLVHGQLMYNRSASKEALSQLSMEDRVFRCLCRTIMAAQRYHLLCRAFKNKGKQSLDLPAFYAIDISHVTMSMASS